MSENSTPHEQELDVEVVVPVYDEERSLAAGIRALHAHLTAHLPQSWRITIADNASTDATPRIADELAAELPQVCAVHLNERGRGRALKQVWLASPAAVVAYLDVDLSTDLAAVAPLIAPLLSGHSDLAIGTRLDRASRVMRGGKREFISRGYNTMLRMAGARFSDAQCGFKAMRTDVARRLLPLVEDTGWFFDTELLLLAERAGLRIHEVPVDWVDDPQSSVDIWATAVADMRGLCRVWWGLARGRVPVAAIYAEFGRHPYAPPTRPGFFGQVLRFGAIGVLSTAAYALLYLALQQAMTAQVANFAALLITAVANTWANRRFTFGVRGPERALAHQVQGLVVFGIAWAITSGSLSVLGALRPDASSGLQIAVLTCANLLATVVRFVLLRAWVFARERRSPTTVGGPGEEPPSVPGSVPQHPIASVTAHVAEPVPESAGSAISGRHPTHPIQKASR
ncbi:glycosyltransferase [Rathayibacter sp. KR2-224]|uniref:glycosyltransferase n=1 Tax=Rathayibacter sp. KR2-224 TaxID=3400913 RepID=UPI003BFCF9C7